MALPASTYDDPVLFLQNNIDYIVPQSTIQNQEDSLPFPLNLYKVEDGSETLIEELRAGDRIQKFATEDNYSSFVITKIRDGHRNVEFVNRRDQGDNSGLTYLLYIGIGSLFE